jgi:hypothetical protein
MKAEPLIEETLAGKQIDFTRDSTNANFLIVVSDEGDRKVRPVSRFVSEKESSPMVSTYSGISRSLLGLIARTSSEPSCARRKLSSTLKKGFARSTRKTVRGQPVKASLAMNSVDAGTLKNDRVEKANARGAIVEVDADRRLGAYRRQRYK